MQDKYGDMNCLICEDYPSMMDFLRTHLQTLGLGKIHEATSGNQGFKILKELAEQEQKIDFVITDMIMDNGDGVQLVQKMRQEEPFKNLPILILTSENDRQSVVKAIKAGVDAYLIKPWKLEDLEAKIVEILAKRAT
jgi:two-component system chemotaxis response regulator CheY